MENINQIQWSDFVLSEIFKIKSTKSGIDKNKIINHNGLTPYITRSEKTNGWEDFIGQQSSRYNIDNGNCISIGLDTQTVFYQPSNFYTGQNIQVLKNDKLNKHIALFIIPLLKQLMDKFNWGGNGATLTRLKRSRIILPVIQTGEPDWLFMEQYMKDLETKKLISYQNYISNRIKELSSTKKIVALKDKNFTDFFIEDIVEILSGKDIYERERQIGITPYITATANNNGIGYFVNNNNNTLESNCISVNRNGSVGYAFYHPYLGLYGNDTRKLRPNVANKYVALFVTQAINRQRGKYGYGYKMGTGRLKRQKILLPIKSDQTPDYEYMEQYMKQIEVRKLKYYMEYINKKLIAKEFNTNIDLRTDI